MSKETCTVPSCTHGKGFNCPVCWPTGRMWIDLSAKHPGK